MVQVTCTSITLSCLQHAPDPPPVCLNMPIPPLHPLRSIGLLAAAHRTSALSAVVGRKCAAMLLDLCLWCHKACSISGTFVPVAATLHSVIRRSVPSPHAVVHYLILFQKEKPWKAHYNSRSTCASLANAILPCVSKAAMKLTSVCLCFQGRLMKLTRAPSGFSALLQSKALLACTHCKMDQTPLPFPESSENSNDSGKDCKFHWSSREWPLRIPPPPTISQLIFCFVCL